MDLIGLPDGQPGQHLGVSHMLKHYLSPAEVWEDLVPEGAPHRPWAVLDWLGPLDPRASAQHRTPGDSLRTIWHAWLVPIFRHGYLAVAKQLAEPLPALGAAPWRPADGAFVTFTSEGVVLIVARVQDSAKLLTAFRPLGYTLKDHHSVPMSAQSRDLRSVIARQKARRQVNDIASGGRQ